MRYWMAGIVLTLMLLLAVPPALAQEQQEPPEAEVSTHTVRTGETLYRISRMYGLTVEELRELNDLDDYTIYIGQELIVERPEEEAEAVLPERPGIPVADTTAALPEPDSLTDEPDTLASPADTLAPAADEPAPEPTEPPAEEEEALPPEATEPASLGAHHVERGETLYEVAARYGLSVDTLRAINEDLPTFLEPEQTLYLPPSLAAYTHVVEEGESLVDVAAQYGVSVRGLQHYNQLESQEVKPGQELRIPGRPAPEPEPRGTLPPFEFSGPVLAYPDAFEGRLTASGEPYDPEAFTVSHPDLAFDTVVLLTNPATGRSTFARVNDRGPLDDAYVMDVSAAVQQQLGLGEESEQDIDVRIVERAR